MQLPVTTPGVSFPMVGPPLCRTTRNCALACDNSGMTLAIGYAGRRGVAPGLVLLMNAVVLLLVGSTRFLHSDLQGQVAALLMITAAGCSAAVWTLLRVTKASEEEETESASETAEKEEMP